MANSAPDPKTLIIPDHALGWGPISLHTRYFVDALLVLAGLGALFVSLFLMSEPDIMAVAKKTAALGAKAAEAATVAA